MTSIDRVMTLEEKRSFYRDGYVVIKEAIQPELVEAARQRIASAKKGDNLWSDSSMLDLINGSSVTPILHEAMGNFDPPTLAQVGIIKQSKPGDRFNSLGYRDRDTPYYGAAVHIDGNITISPPQEVQEGLPEEIYMRHFAA